MDQASDPKKTNIKETIDQILLAFIFALIFRCFIMEAYVIPTGSMAPTLMGAHMDFRCPDCGWRFAVDFPAQGNNANVPARAAQVYPIRCPNCAYKLPPQLPADANNDADQPVVSFGDRILVMKYDYLFRQPSRWDVVVFKTPSNSPERNVPEADEHQENFIKRLVGRAGETIMILDGDIYTSTVDKPLDQLAPSDFTVQAKPYAAQSALWRIVYDNDHQPRGAARDYEAGNARYTEPAWSNPWVPVEPNSGWSLDRQRIDFKGDAPSQTYTLDFQPDVSMASKYPLSDWLAYDATKNVDAADSRFGPPSQVPLARWTWDPYAPRSASRNRNVNPVSDLLIKFAYQRRDGNGPLQVTLTKRGDQFVLKILPDQLVLTRIKADQSTVTIGTYGSPRLGTASPVQIELANVDYRLSVRVEGKEVIASTPEQYRPDVEALLAEFHRDATAPKPLVFLSASEQTATLSHVSVWRDVFYINAGEQQALWASPANLARPRDSRISPEGQLMRLGDDEFFVCGDNSLMSSDARMWSNSVDRVANEDLYVEPGRVPRRFLLGRAFFVYWPAGYRFFDNDAGRVFGVVNAPLVPNAGEMRFIH
jgi:signal peptidase I